jgi:hypothetical protein
MPFSVQGVSDQGLGDVGLSDIGEGIRAVVVVVSSERTERKANVGESRFEVVRWSFEWPRLGVPAAFKLRIHACETGDRKNFMQP